MQCVCTADGAAAVEALRAELVHAKERARASNAAALKAAEELRAEQAAHRRSEEKIAEMAVELKMPPTSMRSLKRSIRIVRLSWTAASTPFGWGPAGRSSRR